MRLLALYSLAALRPERRHTILISPALVPLARMLFADRFDIHTEGGPGVAYTHLGLRHTLGAVVSGRRFVYPFYWLMREQRRQSTFRDRLNDTAIRIASLSGRIVLPSRGNSNTYQGFMELQALSAFRTVAVRDFDAQAKRDFAAIGSRLRVQFGNSRADGVLVFPSGTAHQVLPPRWAAEQLPDACFAFHERDGYAGRFSEQGLRVERFHTPEEMLTLGRDARRVLVTDSFPSHVWQLMGERIVVLLSQQPRIRVVHPGFPDEQIVASRAPCCPCRNRDRGNHSLCDAGREYCRTWTEVDYIKDVERLLR